MLALSVNPADRHSMRGKPLFSRATLGLLRPKHEILGVDVAGRVETAGSAVTRYNPGDEVYAPEGPAAVRTEFHTAGANPMGTFDDRSVVTEATPGRAFEFVTEARLVTKRGMAIDWTNVHRYELEPAAGGCRIAYTIRIARISALTGMLALFKVPGLRGWRSRHRPASRGVRCGTLRALPRRSTRGGEKDAEDALDPELEGRRNFGAELSEFAHADRSGRPEE